MTNSNSRNMKRQYRSCAIKLFITAVFFCAIIIIILFTQLIENEKRLLNVKTNLGKNNLQRRIQPPENSINELVSNIISEMSSTNSFIDWNITKTWLGSREIHPINASHFGDILKRMNREKIVKATAGGVGTQIKMMLTLEGGQKVLFKPIVAQRDFIADSSPYAGIDRHNCEIASFHLNRLLNFRRCPLVIGRKVNLLTEIYPFADDELKKTFFKKGNKICFYGVCYYCRPSEAICADDSNTLEGAVVLWVPHSLRMFRHPWSRTYKKHLLAGWEVNANYCMEVKQQTVYKTGPRLLDLMDTAVFDFITGNADRHHYEVLRGVERSAVLLLDNGKSFGNPFNDEMSILAPMQQCCLIRKSTWDTIQLFSQVQNSISISMRRILSLDPITPILSEPHFLSMDRRLKIAVEEIKKCIDKNGEKIVINDNL